jgi:hypothetical protein
MGHLRDDVLDAARTVGVAGDGLGPETEAAAAAAAPARVERHVWVLQIADVVALDLEAPRIHVAHVGEGVEVVDRRLLRRPHEAPIPAAVQDARHLGVGRARGDVTHGVVELAGGHEIHGRGDAQGLLGKHHGVGAYEADLHARVALLQQRRRLGVLRHRWRGRVQHDELEARGAIEHLVEVEILRRRVDQLAARHEGRGLGQPGRIPERATSRRA